MRDFRDAKTMARALRSGLGDQGLAVTHSQSLELMAKAFGYENWNILSAKIDDARPTSTPAAPTGGKTLYCSFCGKSQFEVAKLIAGPNSLICDVCVGLCTDIIEHGAVLALLAEDEAAGGEAAGYPKLSAYFEARSAEEFAAYLAKVERELVRMREGLDAFNEAIAARAAGQPVKPTFKNRTDEELVAQAGRMDREIAATQLMMRIVGAWLRPPPDSAA